MLDHIGGPTDREISSMLQKEYTKRGVEFLLGAKVTSVGSDCVNYELGGKQLSAKGRPCAYINRPPRDDSGNRT